MPDAAALVLIPGINNSAAVWQPLLDRLPAGLCARAVDCPPLADIDQIAGAMLADLPERLTLVGHSFGGYVALAMLAHQPARVRAIALVNSGCGADGEEQRVARVARAKSAVADGYEEQAMSNLDLVYHSSHVGSAPLLAARRSGIREYGVERFLAHSVAASNRPDRANLLRASDIPKLVLAADADRVIPAAAQRATADFVGARFRVLAEAGHMLPAERPAALADEIANWARGLSA